MRIGLGLFGVLKWIPLVQTASEPVAECDYGDDFEAYKIGLVSVLNTLSDVWSGNGAVSQNYMSIISNMNFESESLGAASSIASGTGWNGNGAVRINS